LIERSANSWSSKAEPFLRLRGRRPFPPRISTAARSEAAAALPETKEEPEDFDAEPDASLEEEPDEGEEAEAEEAA
jgi:hypothetical protein